MKKRLPVLALLMGLGSLISCKHSPDATTKPTIADVSVQVKAKLLPAAEASAGSSSEVSAPSGAFDPFDRYLASEKAHSHEAAMTRFTGECGIDIMTATPKYAQRPEETWNVVPDLSRAKGDLETDFYGTAAVWHKEDRTAIERWGMELDTGDYYRLLYCLNGKTITAVESVSWSMAESVDSGSVNWGYERRWRLNSKGELDTVSQRFIDPEEKPMAQPKLDSDTLKSLKDEAVGAKTWAELELPAELLK